MTIIIELVVNPYIFFTDRLDARIVSIVMRVIRNLEDNGIIMFVSFINPRFIYSNLLARQVIFFSIYSYYTHIYYLLHSMLFFNPTNNKLVCTHGFYNDTHGFWRGMHICSHNYKKNCWLILFLVFGSIVSFFFVSYSFQNRK